MHSTHVKVEGKTYYCHHWSSYNGEIIVNIPLAEDEEPQVERDGLSGQRYLSVEVPFAVMKELVGSYLMSLEIERLENMNGANYVESLAGRREHAAAARHRCSND